MTGFLERSAGLVESVARICERMAIGALFIMTALVTAQIVGREILSLGLPGVEELARWSGLCLVYFAVPLLFLECRHVSVDMFLVKLRGPLRKGIDIALECLTVAFTLAFLVGGWFFMQRAGKFSTPALGMPNLLFYAPVLFGMALSMLAGLVRVYRTILAPAGESKPC
ncbi:MAG: TRAP transporter small permease [Rhabdaerophilum sp.]|jgi:TRAP-type C4-dicarboxylate transport system permease small subunit